MRITALVVLACVATTTAARADWRAQIRWRRAEKPRELDAPPAPASVYLTAGLREAQGLTQRGQLERATARLSRVIVESGDPREVCRARILAVRIAVDYGPTDGKRAAVIDLAANLRSRRGDDDCRREGDALVGQLAWAFDLESRELDPMTIVPLWEAASAIATTEARRTTALHDRALVYWRRAEWGDATSVRWRAAAVAAEQAVAADPGDDDMVGRARDAWWNAGLFTRNER